MFRDSMELSTVYKMRNTQTGSIELNYSELHASNLSIFLNYKTLRKIACFQRQIRKNHLKIINHCYRCHNGNDNCYNY